MDVVEKRIGCRAMAYLVAIVAAGAPALWVRASIEPAAHGNWYSILAQAPFAPEAPETCLRILSPFVGYLLGLSGPRFPVLMLLAGVLWFAETYKFLCERAVPPELSGLCIFYLTFSLPWLHQLVMPGYVDPATCLLFVVLLRVGAVPLWALAVSTLMLLNHEASLFLLPAVIARHFLGADGAKRWKTVGALAGGVVLSGIGRSYLASSLECGLTGAGYLAPAHVQANLTLIGPTLLSGSFAAFRLLWLFPLGVALALGVRGLRREMLVIAIALLAPFGALLVAFDTSRLVSFAFPALVFAFEMAARAFSPRAVLRLALPLFAINFLVTPYMVAQGHRLPIPTRLSVPRQEFVGFNGAQGRSNFRDTRGVGRPSCDAAPG